MSKELASRILQQYGYTVRQSYAVEKGYRNQSYPILTVDNQHLNLIIYKHEAGILDRIRRANYVSNYLASQGIPARQSADPRIIQLRSPRAMRYAALYHYLPGVTIAWEAYTSDHIKTLGAMLGTMHQSLRELDRLDLPSVSKEYTIICDRMHTYFSDNNVSSALRHKLGLTPPTRIYKYRHLFAICDKISGQQILHMDFVRSNLVFASSQDATITGILDFEKTAWGHPVFDIARTLAFLLIDCKYKEPDKVQKYFVNSGYRKRSNSTINHQELLEPLVNLFLMYDFYKFLRHNPYEFLPTNEHFIRTRDYLLKHNIISKIT